MTTGGMGMYACPWVFVGARPPRACVHAHATQHFSGPLLGALPLGALFRLAAFFLGAFLFLFQPLAFFFGQRRGGGLGGRRLLFGLAGLLLLFFPLLFAFLRPA